MADAGTDELALLEVDPDLPRVCGSSVVARARAQLLATGDLGDRVVMLGTWSVRFPSATARLLSEIGKEPETAASLASTVLGCRVLDSELKDELLTACFHLLEGPVRDAAADRARVREWVGLTEGDGYVHVPEPDPTWLWPAGVPFPDLQTTSGIQARLNYLGLGAGPINDEWNERTRFAFTRFQVLHWMAPTGDPDFLSVESLGFETPEAPERQE